MRARTRAALPSGRAIAGGLLVACSALGLFAAYSNAQHRALARFEVAARDLAPGTVLDDNDVESAALDLPASSRARAYASSAALVGKVIVGPVLRGELVQTGSVADHAIGEQRFEVALTLDGARAITDRLATGESVDVLATYGSGESACTRVIARRARVQAIGNASEGLAGRTSAITLGVLNPNEVVALVTAAQAAKVTLVRSTAVPDDRPLPGEYCAATPSGSPPPSTGS